MPGQGVYSEKYSALRRSEAFGVGGEVVADWHHGSLTTDGVAGAQPQPQFSRFTNKGPHAQASLAKTFPEAPGMHPREFVPKRPRNVPDFALNTRDIEGASPDPRGASWHCGASPRGTTPLDPQYRLPTAKQEPPPVPKFLRDPLDVSDIAGARAVPDSRPQRGLRSLDASDIPGAQPGWRPPSRQRNPPRERNPLDVSDIVVNDPTPQQKHQQLMEGRRAAAGSGQQQQQEGGQGGSAQGSPCGCSCGFDAAGPAAAAPLSDVGAIKSVEWRRQQYASIRECGEAAKQARAEAQEALGAGAQQIASTAALSALLRGFRAFDKDRSGRVQSGEFAAVLSHAGLGLSSDEVCKVVGGMRDQSGLVEYKSFMGTLFTKAQQHRQQAQQAQQAPRASPRPAGPPTCHLNSTQRSGRLPKAGRQAAAAAAAATEAAAAAEQIALPNWAAARQRRLSTAVALTLNQQPAFTAVEAASVASPQHWHARSPRRFSMHAPDPSAVDRSGVMPRQPPQQQQRRQPATQQLQQQRQGAPPGSAPGTSFCAEKAAPHTNAAVSGSGSGSSSGCNAGVAGSGAESGADVNDDPLFALNTTRGTGAPVPPKSRGWAGGSPAATPGSRRGAPVTPNYVSGLAGPRGVTTGRSSAAAECGAAAAAAVAPAPGYRHATAPVCTGPQGTAAGSPAAVRAAPATAVAGSPGRMLPLLPHPLPPASGGKVSTLGTGKQVAAERACRQQLQEEIALVRSLS